MPDPLTLDEVATRSARGRLDLRGPRRAEDLVAEQHATLAAVQKPTARPPRSGTAPGPTPPTSGRASVRRRLIMDAAGLTNIFADVHDTWTSAGWEQVVAADPDVIVLVDAAWNTADKKIAMLEANPATSQLTAVREHRYLTVPFAAGEAGVRTADAAVSLSEQLAASTRDMTRVAVSPRPAGRVTGTPPATRARRALWVLVGAGALVLVVTVLVTVTIGPADLGVAEVARSIAGTSASPVTPSRGCTTRSSGTCASPAC